MNLVEIIVDDFGGAPFAEHNMPCAVCWERSAVLFLNAGVFEPCWECQREGWELKQKGKWRRWRSQALKKRLDAGGQA